MPRQDQTIQTQLDVLKQGKKILPTSRGRMDEVIPTTGYKKGRKIFEQNMEAKKKRRNKKQKQKSRMDKHGNRAAIHPDALKTTLEKITN